MRAGGSRSRRPPVLVKAACAAAIDRESPFDICDRLHVGHGERLSPASGRSDPPNVTVRCGRSSPEAHLPADAVDGKRKPGISGKRKSGASGVSPVPPPQRRDLGPGGAVGKRPAEYHQSSHRVSRKVATPERARRDRDLVGRSPFGSPVWAAIPPAAVPAPRPFDAEYHRSSRRGSRFRRRMAAAGAVSGVGFRESKIDPRGAPPAPLPWLACARPDRVPARIGGRGRLTGSGARGERRTA